jgi:hypothetical protein
MHRIDIQKAFLAALVIAHIAWIVNHLRLVANDEINPWRLGGYGMYTVPEPRPRFDVVDRADPTVPALVEKRGFDIALRYTNPLRTFRCAPVPPEALHAFFVENRNLIGRDIAIVYSELKFSRSPPSASRDLQGEVIVSWPDPKTFTYTNKFCGTESTGTAAFDE